MSDVLISPTEGETIPLHALRRQDLDGFLARRRPMVRAQAEAQSFKGSAGQTCAILRADGKVELALIGLGPHHGPPPRQESLQVLPPQGVQRDGLTFGWADQDIGHGSDRYRYA